MGPTQKPRRSWAGFYEYGGAATMFIGAVTAMTGEILFGVTVAIFGALLFAFSFVEPRWVDEANRYRGYPPTSED